MIIWNRYSNFLQFYLVEWNIEPENQIISFLIIIKIKLNFDNILFFIHNFITIISYWVRVIKLLSIWL